MICIGFGTNQKWTSKLIRWATKSEWSHTWITYPSSVWGGYWAAHSGPNGVVKIPLERMKQMYPESIHYELGAGVDDFVLGFEWASQHVGQDYDYGVIWNALLLVLWRATGWRYLWKLVARNSTKFTCSEFVTGFLIASGVPGILKVDPELTPPGVLQEFCDDSPECRRAQ